MYWVLGSLFCKIVMEEPEWTYWPTQYISLDKDKLNGITQEPLELEIQDVNIV